MLAASHRVEAQARSKKQEAERARKQQQEQSSCFVLRIDRPPATMVRPRGKPSTGRHRIEMSPIANRSSRQVTFSKRRSGLFKKGSELAILCGARVVLVVFSEVGNVFALGSPSADAVLGYDGGAVSDEGEREALEGMCRAREEAAERVAAETARMDSIGDKVAQAQAGRRSWWEADVGMLGEAELPEFARALTRFRDDVRRHADKLLSSAPQAAAPVAAPAACTTAAVSPGTLGDPSSSNSWDY